MHASRDTLHTRDDIALELHRWTPDGQPRGTIVITHGLGEHGGRYAPLAADLTAKGWEVTAFDHRGHGASPGPRGAIPGPLAIRHDILDALTAARRDMRRGALVLLGHSMGGAFAADAIASAPDAADALVLSSPALRADLTAVQHLLMRIMGTLGPSVAIGNGLDAAFLSHDPQVVAAYRSDPLVHDRVTARLAQAMMTAGATALAAAPQWRTPTLLLWAGADRLVNPAGSAAFAAAAPGSVVQSQVFEPLYHEIFNERDRARPVAALLDWLAALPSA